MTGLPLTFFMRRGIVEIDEAALDAARLVRGDHRVDRRFDFCHVRFTVFGVQRASVADDDFVIHGEPPRRHEVTRPTGSRNEVARLRRAVPALTTSVMTTGGSPVAGHFSCAAKKSNRKKAAPGFAPRCSRGDPVLPDSMWRLRNSTWRGTQNVPHCGTDSVPGGRSLGRNPSHGHLYRRRESESTHLFPQTELRLTCHRCTVLEGPPSSRAARRASRGTRKQALQGLRRSLSPRPRTGSCSVLSPRHCNKSPWPPASAAKPPHEIRHRFPDLIGTVFLDEMQALAR